MSTEFVGHDWRTELLSGPPWKNLADAEEFQMRANLHDKIFIRVFSRSEGTRHGIGTSSSTGATHKNGLNY